ncbi:MAG: GNAT family N-acetyltransferase [Pseudomonadota bacterium]
MEIAADAVVFSPAGQAQMDTLARLYVQLSAAHDDAYSAEEAAAKLARVLAAGAKAVVMTHGDRLIGSALWMDMGDHYFIRNYVIEESCRGQGLGGALVARLRAEILSDKPIRLEASAGHSRRFWAAQGFEQWSTGFRSGGHG